MKLTTHPQLAPSLRKHGAIPPFPHTSSWHGAHRGNFNFKVCIHKNLSDAFPIQNGPRRCFIAMAFQLCFRIWQQEGMELNGTHQLLAYADINILGRHINTIRKNKGALLEAGGDDGLDINTEKIKYMVMFHHKN
jgi:hypothetical protein